MSGRPGRPRTYDRGPMPAWLQELEAGYFRYLTRRGRRPDTLTAYRFELQDFATWMGSAGVASLAELQRSHIEQWQDDVATRKSLKTQQLAAAAVRGLLRWCANQELEMSNNALFLRVDSPRVPASRPRPIPRADLEVLQSALAEPDRRDIIQLRTRALFWVLFSSGSRISAALSMDRDSIRDRSADVIQKGGRTHTLLFSDLAVAAVNDYLGARLDDNPALFVGHPGQWRCAHGSSGSRPITRLTKNRADACWYQLAKALEIGRFSSHRIRHSCGTSMLRNHVEGIVIAKHLGHHGLETVMAYAEVGLERRRDAVDALDVQIRKAS
ncbi:MAG: tyrosine-type recombinase/integrase [Candidatus Dormibacterales bacterium]